MTRLLLLVLLILPLTALAQPTHPAVSSWLRNTTGVRGRHYVQGNATPIQDTAHANVQRVRYSATSAYVDCSGIPAYVIGPYLDGNPSQAGNRRYLFKIPLAPAPNAGAPTPVGLGQTGVPLNALPAVNSADARSYNTLGAGHQNAVVSANAGFDCAKGHPTPGRGPGAAAGGSYHHHQNPSAFNIATVPLSTVCDIYLADGLYVPDSAQHGPLIGFAFDGYPIYGGYGYANPQQPGAVRRLVPGFRKRAIAARTSLPNGTGLPAAQHGPTLAAQPLGSYFEDYEYVPGLGDLDEHNGRLCVTPEYPQGTYAYFATLDATGNSVFPYVIGTTYYGVVETSNFPTMGSPNPTSVVVNEPTTTYTGPVGLAADAPAAPVRLTAFPSPTHQVLVVQVATAAPTARTVGLLDATGRAVAHDTLRPGATMCYFDTQTLRPGPYVVRMAGAGTVRVVVGE